MIAFERLALRSQRLRITQKQLCCSKSTGWTSVCLHYSVKTEIPGLCAGEGVLQDALDACLKTGMLQESDPVVVVQQMVHKLDAWVSSRPFGRTSRISPCLLSETGGRA